MGEVYTANGAKSRRENSHGSHLRGQSLRSRRNAAPCGHALL